MHSQILPLVRRTAIWFSVAAMIGPPRLLLAEQVPSVAPQQARSVDVALGAGGALYGQAVDAHGRPAPATRVYLSDGRRAWRNDTNEHGRFKIEGLPSSVYEARAGDQRMVVRVWPAAAAPPQAAGSLLLVSKSRAVLGQQCASPVPAGPARGGGIGVGDSLLLGGVVAAAVAVPVALHNSDDDPPPATP